MNNVINLKESLKDHISERDFKESETAFINGVASDEKVYNVAMELNR